MCGDYAAFHEVTIRPEYDLTNNIQIGEETLEELMVKIEDRRNYCDYDKITAYKSDGGSYYMKIG